ncbi:MAG TPA: hypothetical protein VHY22_04220 [Chthoniobacteraceae bacterium]|jgi:hypothetical protein|nr:hypothetical protein [Chthoniobacteraceae bacterium]
MSKRQKGEGAPFSTRLAAQLRSLTLTRQEQAMVAVILLSMLAGSVILHYRREYRLRHPAAAAPSSGAPRSTGGRTAAGSP